MTIGPIALHPATGARNVSGYICARAAVTASEQITVPEGATHVVLSADLPFYVEFGDDPEAAVPADTDDGTANELINPATPAESRTFQITGIAKLAVAAAAATAITASFYTS